MEVHVISNESITLPSHLATNPFKISVIDQLYPSSLYSSLILFYPSSSNIDISSSHQLKTSLAKTIIPFYPIAGSAQDNNFVIDNFDKGVRFIETRVVHVTSLSEYLRQPKIETLEVLLPCESFKALAEPPEEQLLVQLNRFDCGGIGLGLCFSHRIIDATTINAFLSTWAVYNTQLYFPCGNQEKEIEYPDLSTASQHFPPQQDVKLSHGSKSSNSISDEISFRKKRFVFSAESIDNLKLLCKSKAVEKPSRVEALTAFIWKSLASASASAKPSSIFQAVNIRSRTNPRLPKNTVGSLILPAFMCHDKEGEMELAELVRLQRETVSNFYIQCEEIDLVKERKKFMEMAFGKMELYSFSSWLGFGFHEINFGWGKPAWVAIPGMSSFDATYLNELGANTNAVEAWITAKEEKMSVLEKDPEFLVFATPNPSILLDK